MTANQDLAAVTNVTPDVVAFAHHAEDVLAQAGRACGEWAHLCPWAFCANGAVALTMFVLVLLTRRHDPRAAREHGVSCLAHLISALAHWL